MSTSNQAAEPTPQTYPHDVNEWVKEIGQWSEEKGWNETERSVGDWAALFHTEISEYYEEYRNHHEPNEVYFSQKTAGSVPKPEGQGVEIADVLIRIFHWAHAHGIDL